MAYAHADDCLEIYMMTPANTKKYSNLKQNPSVSLLIDSRKTGETRTIQALTITGIFLENLSQTRKHEIRQCLIHAIRI
jgi:general stress protein 26